MKKFLSNIIKNHYKTIFKSLILSESKYLKINYQKLQILKNCSIGKKNETIYTPIDEIISPYLFINGGWDEFIIKFIFRHTKKKRNNIFLDVGANIGLISKQLLNKKIKFKKIYCFEPSKNNFECLKLNLNNYKNVIKYNFGLGEKDQIKKLYLNKFNFGDYSLNNKKKYFEKVKILNINNFFRIKSKFLNDKNIIYKSDTQGWDEILFIKLNRNYFKKINLFIIEITNHKFIKKNFKEFLDRIKYFKTIYTDDEKINKKTLVKKIKFNHHFNLLLSK